MKLRCVGIITAMATLSGCASIVSGHNQSVSVVAKSDAQDVAGARCSLTNDKGQWFATTPGSVTVRRSYSALAIDCKTDSFAGTVQAKSTTKPMAFGNIIFGGVIGVGVDVATGAAYDYPDLITVSMIDSMSQSTLSFEQASRSPVGTAITSNASSPSITVTTAAVVPTPPPVERSAPKATPVALVVAPTKRLIAETPVRPPVGQDEYQARRLAQDLRCYSAPRPVLIGKAPATETYAVECADGQAVAISCEYGSCRVLK